ncbi:hypothetical protein HHI36_000336, partial [Cryptolaemus montrouzieri]
MKKSFEELKKEINNTGCNSFCLIGTEKEAINAGEMFDSKVLVRRVKEIARSKRNES